MTPMFSIVILTKNSMNVVNRLVDNLLQQEFPYPFEMIFMDNHSTDGTVEYLQQIPFALKRIIHVPTGDFSHSRTRMRAAELAQGKYLVFFTDDVIPINKDFLAQLTEPVRLGRARAAYGVYQISPLHSHDPIDAFLHNDWYLNYDEISEPLSPYCWDHLTPMMQRRLCNFDNCASCIDRQLLLDVTFPNVPYGEDMLFAKNLIRNNQRVALAKKAKFFHWHKVRFGYILKRMCIDQHLSIEEFNIYYVTRMLGVLKAILKRVLHRSYIVLFHIHIPFYRKLYWMTYNTKTLTADFIGKYIGTLNQNRLKKFSPMKKRLLKTKNKILAEIQANSIRRY